MSDFAERAYPAYLDLCLRMGWRCSASFRAWSARKWRDHLKGAVEYAREMGGEEKAPRELARIVDLLAADGAEARADP